MRKLGHMQTAAPSQLSTLPFSEQFCLWAVRLWVRSHRIGGSCHGVLYKGFGLIGALEAYYAFDGLLTILFTTAHSIIDIRNLACPEISHDEQRLLGMIAMHQGNVDPKSREILLLYWLPHPAVDAVQNQLSELAATLSQAGLIIDSSPTQSVSVFSNAYSCLSKEPATIH